MTNTTSTYTVRMIMGNDTATTVTTVESDTPENAAREAEMKWSGITVKIVDIDGPEGCYVDLCENDDHWCCNCEVTHLESDGTCFNCSY
jgi:hypothetical protein